MRYSYKKNQSAHQWDIELEGYGVVAVAYDHFVAQRICAKMNDEDIRERRETILSLCESEIKKKVCVPADFYGALRLFFSEGPIR